MDIESLDRWATYSQAKEAGDWRRPAAGLTAQTLEDRVRLPLLRGAWIG